MSLRWWAVYRGGQYIEHVRATSGERALDAVSEREGIPLAELDAVDHDAMERSGLALVPMMLRELGPEFLEPGPAVPVPALTNEEMVLWADECIRWQHLSDLDRLDRANAALERHRSQQPDPIPDNGPTPADMRGEVEHE